MIGKIIVVMAFFLMAFYWVHSIDAAIKNKTEADYRVALMYSIFFICYIVSALYYLTEA